MDKYAFQYGSEPKPTVTKTGEARGNVAKWFVSDSKSKSKDEEVEGDITTFEYEGSKASLPTKIFEKNFLALEL